MARDLRCGNCGRMLGVVLEDGQLQVEVGGAKKRTPTKVVLEVGTVDCTRCGQTYAVSARGDQTTSVSTRVFRTG